jgi:PAS domain S-box-containing protein
MGKATILVVEDEIIVGKDLQDCLTGLGYTVPQVVATAEEAVQQAAELRPDLVLMDVLLKGEASGIEAAVKIRNQQDIPVILLTTCSDDAILDKAKIVEPFGYIIKPYQKRELASIIEMALYKARMERKVRHLHNVLRAIRNINQLIVEEKDRDRLLQGACDSLVETRGYIHSWIVLVDDQRQVTKTTGAGPDPRMDRMIHSLNSAETMLCLSRSLDQPGVVQVEDTNTVCRNCPLGGRFGDRLGIVTSLTHDGKSYGVLGVSLIREALKVDEEKELLLHVAGDIAYALHNMEIETKHRQTVMALRESEEQFRQICDQSLTGIFIHQGGKLVYVNPCLARMLGYDPGRPEEYLGRPFLGYIHPADREFVTSNVTRRMKGEEVPDQYATRLINIQGETVWVEVMVKLIDIGGQPAFMGNILDITLRKEAEEALLAERNRAQGYLDIADVMLIALDSESRVTMINRRGCEVLGYPEKEILGKIWFDHFLPARLRDEVEAVSKKLLMGEMGTVRHFENPVLTMNGTERTVAWHNVSIRDDAGAIVGHLSSGEDITERKLVESEKQKLEDQLRQAMKMEAIGRLAGGIAHDFNNILTGIIGYAELIQSKISPLDPILPDLKEIQEAGERAAALTHQLLAFSRKQIITPRVIDLNKTIDRANRMIGRIIGEDIELNFVPQDRLWPVRMDPAQVDQILINLATNARDAMPSGGKLTIETANISLADSGHRTLEEELPPGDYTMIAISDDGAGMNAETQGKIFEPFFSTKEKDRGTGLGLATVYGIVKQSEGYISVYSEVGSGTTFKIYFPREKAEAEAVQEPSVAEHPRGSETILLVEDEDMVRTLALRILEKQGYRVLTAANGEDAGKLCRNAQWMVDLLLTDVIMPRMNGRELFNTLKEMQPNLKVLFMSGYTDDVVARHGILEVGTNFLAKPFTIREIARAVRRALDDR